MKSAIRIASTTLVTLALVSTCFAQKTIGPDAGAKIRGEWNSGWSNHEYARQQSRAMYYYQTITPAAPPQVVAAQVETVKTAVQKSDDLLKSIKENNAKDPEVVKLVDSILKHHAAAITHCNMAGQCAIKGDGAHVVANCCAEMHDEFEAANKELLALKKHLKVEDLPVPKKNAFPAKK